MDEQEPSADEQLGAQDVATELCGACASAKPRTEPAETAITLQIHPGRDLPQIAILTPLVFVATFAAVFTIVRRRRAR